MFPAGVAGTAWAVSARRGSRWRAVLLAVAVLAVVAVIAAPAARATSILPTGGSLVAWGFDGTGQVSGTPTGSDFVAVAAGTYHNVALRSDGSLVSWGHDAAGQVSGTPAGSGFAAVAAGYWHSVAVRSDGSLVSWGQDGYGVVSGTPADSGFVAAAAGRYYSVALRGDGSLVSWGADSHGEVSSTPTSSGFVAVAAGAQHSVALGSDGSLVSWGDDDFGLVSATPTGTGFVAVAAGDYTSVALHSDGRLVSWGFDDYGQVSGTPTDTGFTAVAAGDWHTVALRGDGSLVSWGRDDFGQVSGTPTGTGFMAVAGGGIHSVAIRAATPSDTVAPVITMPDQITVPADADADGLAQPTPVRFTVTAIDDTDGPVTAACTPASGSLFTLGTTTVTCAASDAAGNMATASFDVHVVFAVVGGADGFSIPVNENRAAAGVRAGAVVPIRFSLGRYYGDVFATGYPKSQQTACTNETVEAVETSTDAAGNGGLHYDASVDQYTYNWKTDRAWAGTCRQLDIRFKDGNTYTSTFVFR